MSSSLIICKNCQHAYEGKFCNHCGEKVIVDRDKTIGHFFEDALHFITHLDGTLVNTLKTMFLTPGKLSFDYCAGIRKKYFKPLSLFLLMVIIYLLFPYFQGLNMSMEYYTYNTFYGKLARESIYNVMSQTGLSKNQVASIFHQKTEKLSKFLLIIIIPFTALFFKFIFPKKKKYFFDYLVYATEVNCVYLLWGFLILPFLYWIFSFSLSDNWTGLLILTPVAAYVAVSAKRFFDYKYWQPTDVIILFFIAHSFIVHVIYKMILFFITIIQIH